MPGLVFADSKGREVALPVFGVPIADTHAHLDMLEDPALAIARAARAGVRFIATVADITEDAARTYASLDAWLADAQRILAENDFADTALPRVRIVVGMHPHNAKSWNAAAEGAFRELVVDPRTCAVGELGLDYHYDQSPRETQREVMAAHLRLAHEFGLPAVMHVREAHEDALRILSEVGIPAAGAILHCHTLGAEAARPFIELGCHVSFAGPVTFKKADAVREAAAAVPVGRILSETDCPFMTPEPLRGAKNEPALVVLTAAKMAEARGEAADVFATHAWEAAVTLLDKDRS